MQKSSPQKLIRKPQHQQRPGSELKMQLQPVADNLKVKGSGKLYNKLALITGGDSGIGRAVAILFAKKGADVAIVSYDAHEDAKDTQQTILRYGTNCLLIPGGITKVRFCSSAVAKTIKQYVRIDVLVDNAATHYESKSLEDILTDKIYLWQ